MDFSCLIEKLRKEGKLKLQFENERELIDLLQEAQVNGYNGGFKSNPAGREILYYKEKVEAVENFLKAFHIAQI